MLFNLRWDINYLLKIFLLAIFLLLFFFIIVYVFQVFFINLYFKFNKKKELDKISTLNTKEKFDTFLKKLNLNSTYELNIFLGTNVDKLYKDGRIEEINNLIIKRIRWN